jgi:membrane-associated phospholipid phosphatase
MQFHWVLFLGLAAASAIMMVLEWRGAPVVLTLSVKNDIKRETRFLQQYGQFVCCVLVAWLIYLFGGSPWRNHGRGIAVPVIAAPLMAGLIGMVLKRLLGRVRPGRENAGRFTGFSTAHANYRESFPSNHSATAMALSVGLVYLYPPAAPAFWTLAGITGLLRYLMDAHWPSDVLGGLAMGYAVAFGTWHAIAWALGFAL